MTGAELLTYLKQSFKRTDKDAELYAAITDTILDIKIRYPFDKFKVEDYTVSIAALGNYKVGIPSDMGHIIGDVRVIDGSTSDTLVKKTKQEFDRIYPNQNATDVCMGFPKHWCLFGEQILIGPVPDKTSYNYEISHSTEAVEVITSLTSNVPFSLRNRECLKAGTLYRVFRDLEDDGNAQKWLPIYENEVSKLIENEQGNQGAPGAVEYRDF
jgi:hypothetical protein